MAASPVEGVGIELPSEIVVAVSKLITKNQEEQDICRHKNLNSELHGRRDCCRLYLKEQQIKTLKMEKAENL